MTEAMNAAAAGRVAINSLKVVTKAYCDQLKAVEESKRKLYQPLHSTAERQWGRARARARARGGTDHWQQREHVARLFTRHSHLHIDHSASSAAAACLPVCGGVVGGRRYRCVCHMRGAGVGVTAAELTQALDARTQAGPVEVCRQPAVPALST
jgi:hypothetical protein